MKKWYENNPHYHKKQYWKNHKKMLERAKKYMDKLKENPKRYKKYLQKNKERYNDNKSHYKQLHKEWREKMKQDPNWVRKERKKRLIWAKNNPEKIKSNYKKNREKYLKHDKERRKKIKLEVLSYYSEGKMRCACKKCNIKGIQFLTIDHIKGSGRKHREQLKGNGLGNNMYLWLKKNNFPKGFRVLCWNCNCAKGFFGECH